MPEAHLDAEGLDVDKNLLHQDKGKGVSCRNGGVRTRSCCPW